MVATPRAARGDNTGTAMKSVVDVSAYDWEGDAPASPSSADHRVRDARGGFTRHPSFRVPERARGTFAGLIEKIPYLQRLGITAVELLPVSSSTCRTLPPD